MNNRKRRHLIGAAFLSVAFPVLTRAQNFSFLRQSYDVVIAGAGAAGLSAASEAADAGARVAIFEKAPEIGGNTLISGGFFAAVDLPRQKKQNIEDSVELFYQQTFQFGGGAADPALVRHLVENATEALHWLESLGVRFESDVIGLYGSHWQRVHVPVLPLGTGYIRALSAAALKRGVKICTSADVTDLYFEKGRAAGVVVKIAGKQEIVHASRAVVIASGSFASNNKLVAQHAPHLQGLTTNNIPTTDGELMMAAHRHGVALRDMDAVQCLPGCPPNKKFRVRFHNDVSRHIYVDARARRFIREDAARDDIRDAVLALPEKYGYLIVDNNGFEAAGILTQKEVILAIEGGEAWKASSIPALARKMGLDPQTLKQTIAEYNLAVRNGHDPLGKSPRELKHELKQPPFWACYAGMTVHYTEGGLVINDKAQCLDSNARPIPGLFAAGAVTGGVHGRNRLGGNGLADAVVFGRTAGQNAAAEKN